jgi:hypothetical protein
MDEIDLVHNLLDDQPPPSPTQIAAARARVLDDGAAAQPAAGTGATRQGATRQGAARQGAAIGTTPAAGSGAATGAVAAGRRRHVPGRPRYARRAAVAAVGTAAVAAAVAVAAVPGGPTGTPAASGPGRAPVAPHSAGPSPLSANQILLAAAEKAARQPATGARWQLHSISGFQAVTTGGYVVDHRYDTQLWVPRSASEPTWRIMQDIGSRPATAADVQAWKRAGSPTSWTIPVAKLTPAGRKAIAEKQRLAPKEIIKSPKPETLSAAGHAPYAAREDSNGTAGVITNKPRTLAELAALPTDPAKLRSWLQREISTAQRTHGGTGQSMAAELFGEGMQIAMHLPVSPAVRAAAFRMLADLPGVRAVGEVRDPLGRLGIAVALPERNGDATDEFQLLIDPRTGSTLGYQFVITRPDPNNPHSARVGQVNSYELAVDSGWTNATPRLPSRRVGPEDAVG